MKKIVINNFPTNTNFGYQIVSLHEKKDKVKEVFHSVAAKYDVMNDIMSFGIHRLWKRITVAISNIRSGQVVLDLAGGSGDITQLLLSKVGDRGQVVLADINAKMLAVGRDKLFDNGYNLQPVQADAECLPFASNKFDAIFMGFGLRNVTNKDAALKEIFRICKYGGKVIILEFSMPEAEIIKKAYDWYSFNLLPRLGKLVANDDASYQYLAESIRMHPSKEILKQMIEQAGFEDCHFHSMTGGIVALHIAYKY